VSSQANTLTFDKITKKNGDEKERRDENERQHGPLRLQTKSILVVHPVTSDHHVADELFWCSSNRRAFLVLIKSTKAVEKDRRPLCLCCLTHGGSQCSSANLQPLSTVLMIGY
jgi:hypothetical protein